MMDMANPLAASSVLLAIVAVLFGAWTGDVAKAIDLTLPPQVANREGQRRIMRAALYGKALPLCVGAWLTSAVFAPRVAAIAFVAAHCLGASHCGYDDVNAAFVLTEVFVIVVAVWSTIQFWQLNGKLRGSYRA
jgi:hypothetical protein